MNSGEIDLLFSTLLFGQVAAIFHFGQHKQYAFLFLVAYSFAAMAILTKGLPAVAFQGFALLAYAFTVRSWKWLFSWQHSLGLSICVSIVVGYFWAYAQQTSVLPFLANLLKETTQRTAVENSFWETSKKAFLFFPNLLKLLLPWSLLSLLLIKKQFRQSLTAQPLLLYSLLFIALNIWIYVLSPDGFNRYLYPFFPFFALLFAHLLLSWRPNWYRPILYSILVITSLRIAYNIFGMTHQQATLKNLMYRDLATELRQITKGEPIYWTGTPYIWEANPSLFGYELGSTNLQTPPLIPYQIPYYLSHTGNYTMTYQTNPEPTVFYLAYRDFIGDKAVKEFRCFEERWTKREMCLVWFLE